MTLIFSAISVPMLCIGGKSLAPIVFLAAVFSTGGLATTFELVHKVVARHLDFVLGDNRLGIQRTRMS
jgi:hypothetical protein